ncbi:MAG: tail fiber domain-containing protein, partial [Taibaiella sp.]|nr:tail fiber domain-containing protein [Taibaiella sp.]
MKTSHILTVALGLTCLSTQAQVVNNTNSITVPSPAAAMGINYPPGGTIPGPATEQPQLNIFSTSRATNVGGEAYINCRREIQNGNGDFFEIQNASGGGAPVAPFMQTSFLPMLNGSAFTHSSSALILCGNIDGAQDVVNANPVMDFAAIRGYQRLQTNAVAIQNRPLFRWRNNANILMMMQANGNLGIGIGAAVPTARLHTNGFVRHQNLDIGMGNVLTVDAQGNILNSGIAFNPNPGIQNTCAIVDFVPKVTDALGNLGCSQIFDDGTSVGINTIGPFGYVGGGVFTAGLPGPQAVRLDVVGLTRSTSFVATSDAKYKTNVTALSNSLEAVLKLNPVEYNWNVDKYQDKGFDHLKHSGFLAQELAEVLPNSVI